MSGAPDNAHRHREQGAALPAATFGLITVSDTRTRETDKNGAWLREEIAQGGYAVACDALVPDEVAAIAQAFKEATASGASIIVLNGGTGIGNRDTTVDVISPMLDTPMPGFGELFRMLSWDQVGSAAMLSRAAAGRCGNVMVFVLPGSHAAVQLGWSRLIAPEIQHIVRELSK